MCIRDSNIGADGVHLEMDFHNEREVEQAMRIVEEYSSSSSDVCKEDLSKEEAAATKQETIDVEDSAAAGNEALKPLFNAIVDGKLEPAVEVTKKDVYKRQVDMFSPIGKGQRALIVAQPKTGKTLLLKDIARCV